MHGARLGSVMGIYLREKTDYRPKSILEVGNSQTASTSALRNLLTVTAQSLSKRFWLLVDTNRTFQD